MEFKVGDKVKYIVNLNERKGWSRGDIGSVGIVDHLHHPDGDSGGYKRPMVGVRIGEGRAMDYEYDELKLIVEDKPMTHDEAMVAMVNGELVEDEAGNVLRFDRDTMRFQYKTPDRQYFTAIDHMSPDATFVPYSEPKFSVGDFVYNSQGNIGIIRSDEGSHKYQVGYNGAKVELTKTVVSSELTLCRP